MVAILLLDKQRGEDSAQLFGVRGGDCGPTYASVGCGALQDYMGFARKSTGPTATARFTELGKILTRDVSTEERSRFSPPCTERALMTSNFVYRKLSLQSDELRDFPHVTGLWLF